MNERNKKGIRKNLFFLFFFFVAAGCCQTIPLIWSSRVLWCAEAGLAFSHLVFLPRESPGPRALKILSLSLYSSCIQKYPAATFSLSGSLVARGRATLISGELGFVPCRFYLVNNLRILFFFCKRTRSLSFVLSFGWDSLIRSTSTRDFDTFCDWIFWVYSSADLYDITRRGRCKICFINKKNYTL